MIDDIEFWNKEEERWRRRYCYFYGIDLVNMLVVCLSSLFILSAFYLSR